MITISDEHVGRHFYNAFQNNDLPAAANYLSKMTQFHMETDPQDDKTLQVFLSAHLISAIDLSGNFDLSRYVPVEDIIAEEIARFRAEYSDRPDAVDLLVHHILQKIGVEFELEPNCPSARMQQIRDSVNEHYSDPNLSVNELSFKFGYSVSYLSRTFKKITGVGLNDYIHTVRIRHAQELLRTTGIPISQIAAMVGFSTSSAFIRCYRSIEGITPGSYRARCQQTGKFE